MHEGIHAARGRGSKRARGITVRRLCRSRVVDRMVTEIIRQSFALLQPLTQLGMGEIARDDHWPGKREAGLDRVLGELREDLAHRPAQVNVNDFTAETRTIDFRKILRRVVLELFETDALARDLGERLAIR